MAGMSPALNFQKRFAPLVESGEKRQTIRARRKDGRDPKRGDILYLYTGMRTKQCRKLGEVRCKSVRSIWIGTDGEKRCGKYIRPGVMVWTPCYGAAYSTRLARMDGFSDSGEMRRFFERVHGLPFEGLLIRW